MTAVFGTATPRTAARLLSWDGGEDECDIELAGRAAAARDPEFRTALVDQLLALDRWDNKPWALLRTLIRAGAIEAPGDPRYTILMTWSVCDGREADGVYRSLLADPALLAGEVWRLFELDVVDAAYAVRRFERDPYYPGGWRVTDNLWHRALVRLAAEGRLDRARLLDASLAALGRDFRPSRIAWHGQLHEALEPTAAERRERLSAYLGLMTSSNPAVVRYGLAGVEAIEEDVPPAGLAQAASGPLTLREKKYAVAVLRLVHRALDRAPERATALLAATAQGLGHVRPDVQERALAILERHGAAVASSPALRSAVLGYAESVSPSLRTRAETLVGMSLEPEAAVEPDPGELLSRVALLDPTTPWGAAARAALTSAEDGRWPAPREVTLTPELLRRSYAPLTPIDDPRQLVEVAAVLLEGDGSGADLERFLDGVSRLCRERDPVLLREGSGVAARARAILEEYTWGRSSARIAAAVLLAWLDGDAGRADGVCPSARVEEIARRAARRKPRSLASLPSYAAGWIDPGTLQRRRSASRLDAAWARERATLDPQRPALTRRIEYFLDWRSISRLQDHPGFRKLYDLVHRPLTAEEANAYGTLLWRADDVVEPAGDRRRPAGRGDSSDVEAAQRKAGDPVLVFAADPAASDPAIAWLASLYGSPESRGWKREVVGPPMPVPRAGC